jgi:hypothetical protein
MTVRDGLAEIPDNFDIMPHVDIVAGYDDTCLTAAEQILEAGSYIWEGKLRFLCGPSHLNYDDPIIYPGQQGAAHLHHYFGNTLTDYTSDYESLRTTGSGTCSGGPLNRTGYWHPAMIKPASAGFPIPKVVKPVYTQMYYHNEPRELEDTLSANPAYPHTTFAQRPLPNGLQLITGWEHLHPMPDPFGVWTWDHQAWVSAGAATKGTLPELYDYCKNEPTFSDAPDSGSGYTGQIIARLGSPVCWDGVNLRAASPIQPAASGQSAGRSHLAWPFYGGDSYTICPASHPYRIPNMTFIHNWSNNGPEDWRTWYLSVDRHNGHNLAGGHGFHTDWFGAWSPTIQTVWEEEHLAIGTVLEDEAGKTSVSGILCRDNWGLDLSVLPANIVSNNLPEEFRYEDIPNPPNRRRLRLNLTAA